MKKVLCIALCLCLIACSYTKPKEEEGGFIGRLLVASDADMVATSYVDGNLNKVPGIRDTLSLVSPDMNDRVTTLTVSNSVMSWPSIMDYSEAYKLAYVAESKGEFTGSNQKVGKVWEAMPAGKSISVVKVGDSRLDLLQTVAIGDNIFSVSLNSQQDLLAATTTEPGKELVLCKLKDGLIDDIHYVSIPDVEPNVGIPSLHFHPHENILALNINNKQLKFVRITDDGTLGVSDIGGTLDVAKKWSEGQWMNNGRYFVLSDFALLDPKTNGPSTIKTIAYRADGNHEIVASEVTGLSTEGFSISPDNQYVVAVNMGRSYLDKSSSAEIRKSASLTLLKLGEDGALTRLGKNIEFDGALPEDATFDKASRKVAVVIFHQQDEAYPEYGAIEFWEVLNDRLHKTEKRLPVVRGAHMIKRIE